MQGGDDGGSQRSAMFAYSGCHRIGIAGDWFSAGDVSAVKPSTIEAAWLSGRRLADHLLLAAQAPDGTPPPDVGLNFGRTGGAFQPVDAGGFGDAGGGADWIKPPERGERRAATRAERQGDAPAKRSKAARLKTALNGRGASPRLFVRNVPYAVSEAQLREHIATAAALPADAVASVDLLLGADGRPRGLARVLMSSEELAAAVVDKVNGKELSGRALRVAPDERAG